MNPDERFMERALQLAQLGLGYVSPNPMVGCVVVADNEIIGEGWHRKYGEAHAEANAIASIHDKNKLEKATLYVTLEPCTHVGKTPPCADLIIKNKIQRVVVANKDPNKQVSGQGVEKLRAAGIEVCVGVLEKEGRMVNKRFFTSLEKDRPYIILKWAQTADGFIAHKNFESKWISKEPARRRVHKMRSEEDAVLVGKRTALHDNPVLSVRAWSGRNPQRILIDRYLSLPDTLHLLDGSVQTYVYNVMKNENRPNLSLVRVREQTFLPDMLCDLCKHGIHSILVEGGGQTLKHFIDEELWDEAHVVISRKTFGEGIAAPFISGKIISSENISDDEWRVVHRLTNPHPVI